MFVAYPEIFSEQLKQQSNKGGSEISASAEIKVFLRLFSSTVALLGRLTEHSTLSPCLRSQMSSLPPFYKVGGVLLSLLTTSGRPGQETGRDKHKGTNA